jgi:hypothetical protein
VLLAITNVDLSPSSALEEGHGTRPEQRAGRYNAVFLVWM